MCFWRGESHIDSGRNSVSNLTDSGQEETSKNIPGNTQKRYATIVVAIPTIALVLIKSNEFGVSEIVRETSSIPAYREYVEKHGYQRFATIFQNLGGMPSCPADFFYLRPLTASFTSSMVKGLSSS